MEKGKRVISLLLTVAMVFGVCDWMPLGLAVKEAAAELVWPTKLTKILEKAFQLDSSVKGVLDIPERIEEVGARAFQWTGLHGVEVEGKTEVGRAAFQSDSLAYVRLDDPDAELYKNAAGGARYIFAPSANTEAREYAEDQEGTTFIPLDKLTKDDTFYYTTGGDKATVLVPVNPETAGTSVTIPETVSGFTVSSVGEDGFLGLDKVKQVNVPVGFTIGKTAMQNLAEDVKISEKKEETSEEDFYYRIEDNGEITILAWSNDSVTDLVIPERIEGHIVTAIGQGAFNGRQITSVSIPPSVKEIGKYAFDHCRSLENVRIPEGVTELDNIFGGCCSLNSIEIPSTVVSITELFGPYDRMPRVIYGSEGTEAQEYADANESYLFVSGTMPDGGYKNEGAESRFSGGFIKNSDTTVYSETNQFRTFNPEAIIQIPDVNWDQYSIYVYFGGYNESDAFIGVHREINITEIEAQAGSFNLTDHHTGGLHFSRYIVQDLEGNYSLTLYVCLRNKSNGRIETVDILNTMVLSVSVEGKEPDISFTCNQNDEVITTALVGSEITFNITAPGASRVRLVVDGEDTASEADVASDGSATLLRRLTSMGATGTRQIAFRALYDGAWSAPCTAQEITLTKTFDLTPPTLTGADTTYTNLGYTVEWDAVENAGGYSLYIRYPDGTAQNEAEAVTFDAGQEHYAYTFPAGSFPTEGTHTIRLMVWAEGAEQVSGTKEVITENIFDIVTFGKYPQGGNGEVLPIEWYVLKRDGEKMLLLSRYALDVQPYNTQSVDVTWETCTLRTWLNDTFLNTAFNSREQNAIQTTSVDNSSSQGYDGATTTGGNDTNDKIFLLSVQEAISYFPSDGSNGDNEYRATNPTAYAKGKGARMLEIDSHTSAEYYKYKGECFWWLRSPKIDKQNAAAMVNATGYLGYGPAMDLLRESVRPALWVDLSAIGGGEQPSSLTILSPSDGEELGSADVELTWSAVQGAEYYEVSIWETDASGKRTTCITNAFTNNTRYELALEYGKRYQATVTAYGAGKECSDSVKFRVCGEEKGKLLFLPSTVYKFPSGQKISVYADTYRSKDGLYPTIRIEYEDGKVFYVIPNADENEGTIIPLETQIESISFSKSIYGNPPFEVNDLYADDTIVGCSISADTYSPDSIGNIFVQAEYVSAEGMTWSVYLNIYADKSIDLDYYNTLKEWENTGGTHSPFENAIIRNKIEDKFNCISSIIEVETLIDYIDQADKNYISLFLWSIDDYRISYASNLSGGNAFVRQDNAVYISAPEDVGDEELASIIFHEIGHAIDYNESNYEVVCELNYETISGPLKNEVLKSIYDAIEGHFIDDAIDYACEKTGINEDKSEIVRNEIIGEKNYRIKHEDMDNWYIKNKVAWYDEMKEDYENTVYWYSDCPESFNNDIELYDAFRWALDYLDGKCWELFKKFGKRKTLNNYMVLDMMSAVTNCSVHTFSGHGPTSEAGDQDDYWFKNGKETFHQNREAWAEYFSSMMLGVGKEENISTFKRTCSQFDSCASNMLKYAKSKH